MKSYTIYTDGSCRANGNGGIGVVWLKNGEKVLEYSKGYKDVTNNIMELTAIYIALKSIKNPIDELIIVSDSEYAIGCIFNDKWNPKKNKELIAKIKNQLVETQKLIKNPIKCIHTYGHADDKWNNLCDKLATNESSMVV